MTEPSEHPSRGSRPPQDSPKLTPPDSGSGQKHPSSPSRSIVLLAVSIVLVVGVIVVLFWLPGTTMVENDPVTADPAQSSSRHVPLKSSVSAQQAQMAKTINVLMENWVLKQARAEAERIAVWGGERYTQAIASADECGRLFGENQFLAAKNACSTAIETLDTLLLGKNEQLTEALHAGSQALDNGDLVMAERHFQAALAIEPDHEAATRGLQRATMLPQVMALVDTGLSLESNGDLRAAQQSLQEAVSMDPEYDPAQQALARVDQAIAAGEFQLAMTRSLEALTKGQFSTAEAALDQARQYRPNDPVLADALQELERARRSNQLAQLRAKAKQAERQEHWQEARTACDQALAIDSHAAFAKACLERVSRRLSLDERLQALLSQPERLFEEGPLASARQIVAQALQIEPRGPLLTAQITRLERLIREAETDVEVLIRSDGLTDVIIYHVAQLGQFQEKRLVLRTGDYQAVGRRNGYRDVRQVLRVRPGSGPLVFTLKCEEPI